MFLFTFTVSYIHIVCILEVHTIDYSHFQQCAAVVIGNTAVVCRPNNWWKIMVWSVSNEIHISCSLSCYQILSESWSWHSEFSLFHLSVTVFQQQWQMKRLKVHKLVFLQPHYFWVCSGPLSDSDISSVFLISFSILVIKHSPIKLLPLMHCAEVHIPFAVSWQWSLQKLSIIYCTH